VMYAFVTGGSTMWWTIKCSICLKNVIKDIRRLHYH
jgi:hypothetical protein